MQRYTGKKLFVKKYNTWNNYVEGYNDQCDVDNVQILSVLK